MSNSPLSPNQIVDAWADGRIAELLSAAPDGQVACRSLIDAANDAGGPDNITVVLVRVG